MADAPGHEVAAALAARDAARDQAAAANEAAKQAEEAAKAARDAVEAATKAAHEAQAVTTAANTAAEAAKAATEAAKTAAEQASAQADEAANGVIGRQRIAREKFDYIAARVKGVVHVPFVVAMMLYPTVLGFCLAIRLGRFNLTMPTPHLNTTPAPAAALGSEEDMWKTDGAWNIFLLTFTFVVVSAIHIAICAFILLKSSAGGAYLKPMWAYVAAFLFWAATTLYLFYFVNVARYGVAKGEWIGAFITSVIIFAITVYMIAAPWVTEKVVLGLFGDRHRIKACRKDPREVGGGRSCIVLECLWGL